MAFYATCFVDEDAVSAEFVGAVGKSSFPGLASLHEGLWVWLSLWASWVVSFHDQLIPKIARNNWNILGRNQTTENLHNRKLVFGYRRPKNLKKILLTQIHLKSTLPNPNLHIVFSY